MIIRMLSPSTLSAFSASVSQSGMGQARPVQSIRALGTLQSQPASPGMPPAVALSPRDAGSAPGRVLPRGSLLDLSV